MSRVAARTKRRLIGAVLLLAALWAPRAATAHLPNANPITAQLYWANTGTDSIGRVSLLDPTDSDPIFIPGATNPRGLAIDGTYIYWAHELSAGPGGGSIGRANLDGISGVIQAYVPTAGLPHGLAVDGGDLYWTQVVSGVGSIGRAQLDGFGATQAFVPTGPAPCGVSVSPDALIWANGGTPGSLGRASIDGRAPQQGFLAAANPCGVAIADAHIYWANRTGNSIGRANLDGTQADPTFISFLTSPPCGIAVDGGHIYWTSAAGTIGRARLDGTVDTQSFINNANDPCGVAVAPTIRVSPPADASFAAEVGGESASRTFLIENTSSTVVDNSTVNMTGANPTEFVTTVDTCTREPLPPAGSCRLGVRFVPHRAGMRTAALRISGNASNHPFLVSLAGSGRPDTSKPRLRAASVRPATFAVGPGRGAAAGTTLRYRLSEPARVVFTIRRVPGGRRVARFARAGAEGENSKPFSGRVRGRALPLGPYRVTLVARDRAGNLSRASRAGFRIVG